MVHTRVSGLAFGITLTRDSHKVGIKTANIFIGLILSLTSLVFSHGSNLTPDVKIWDCQLAEFILGGQQKCHALFG